MRKFTLAATVAALCLLGGSTRAEAGEGKCHVHAFFIGFCDSMALFNPCNPCQPNWDNVIGCAPWYTYWPQHAHYQTPTPINFPYWGTPTTPPQGYGFGGHGYGAPSYWYQH